MSPVLYILISLFTTSAMLSVIFWVVWQNFGRKIYALAWSLAFAFSASQWLTNIFADNFPDRKLYWLLATSLQLTMTTLSLWGHRSRVGWHSNGYLLVGIAIAVELVITWFTLFDHHVGIRVSLPVFYVAITLCLTAHALLGKPGRSSVAEKAAACIAIVFAITQLTAGFAALLQGDTRIQAYAELYSTINFTMTPSLFIGLAMFVLLVVASDLSEEMRELAVTDQLTGILNRRGLHECAVKAFSLSKRHHHSLSVIVTDIDHFKQVNDRYGHAAGDKVLQVFVDHLKLSLRDEDIIARMGGEEFIILLPAANTAFAADVAERIRAGIAQHAIIVEHHTIAITASFGVAEIDVHQHNIEQAMVVADQALYRAKNSGRNRVISYAGQAKTNS